MPKELEPGVLRITFPLPLGINHVHCYLLRGGDGSWTLVDPGSANGTHVNGKPVAVNVPVPVSAGDRIHLGAWTTITVHLKSS